VHGELRLVTADGEPPPRPLRDRSSSPRVASIELFADLVYIFAVTQLATYLRSNPNVGGILRSVLLLGIVWMIWVYTTWVTTWVDPDFIEIRLLLIAGILVSLAIAAALPRAFGNLGLVVGGGYALMQAGRSLFMVIVLRGPPRRNFKRILAWRSIAGAFAVAGGLVHGPARVVLWVLAICTDVAGGLVGYAAPELGRSRGPDWTIDGGHFAVRYQQFILIALSQSIIATGSTLTRMRDVTGLSAAGYAVAFAGSVTLWWMYFVRVADASTKAIASSKDPGRLGRTAYQLIHPVMVAGIIVWSVGDEKILTSPLSGVTAASAWTILVGPALFLAGHAAFKWVIWRTIPWERIVGVAALVLLSLAAAALPQVALAACAIAVAAAVAATDHRGPPGLLFRLPANLRPGRRAREKLAPWSRRRITYGDLRGRADATAVARPIWRPKGAGRQYGVVRRPGVHLRGHATVGLPAEQSDRGRRAAVRAAAGDILADLGFRHVDHQLHGPRIPRDPAAAHRGNAG
jgi:low temperature requirement protein LtrA